MKWYDFCKLIDDCEMCPLWCIKGRCSVIYEILINTDKHQRKELGEKISNMKGDNDGKNRKT